jgi:putative nucleotidyltransferase with HDIG domain
MRLAGRDFSTMDRQVILLVETDTTSADAVGRILRGAGHAVHVVAKPDDALHYLSRSTDARLILVSSDGPTDGFGLLAQVRRHHPGVGLILAGAGDIAVVRKAFRLGATDVLPYCLRDGRCGGENLLIAVEHGLQWVERQRQMMAYREHLEQLVAKRAAQLRTLRKDLEHWCEMTIETMGELLDLRDEETEGHSKRVTAYTFELAVAMGLRPAELKTIVRGAYLHDIGKIAVPDAILLKPAKLTEDEMEIMHRHCEHGYGIVRKIPALMDAAEIVYAHQEAFDGSGYPRGLRGEEITLGARIFAIADALDAITSDRPYRRASSFESAYEEIERCSGRQFDPKVVDAFLELPRGTWPMLREETERAARSRERTGTKRAVTEAA